MNTEERIQKEAEEFAHSNWPVVNAIAAYIRGATKEAARNKENAIAFAEFAKNYAYEFDSNRWFAELEIVRDDTGKTTQQLYDLFEQNKKV